MSDCDLWLIITTRGDNGYSFSQFLLNTLANHCGVFSCPVRARSQMSEINWVSTFFSLVGAIRTKYRKKYIKCRVIASTYPVAFSYSYGKLLGGELISQVWLQKGAQFSPYWVRCSIAFVIGSYWTSKELKVKSGISCLACCHCNPTQDKQRKMDGCWDSLSCLLYECAPWNCLMENKYRETNIKIIQVDFSLAFSSRTSPSQC